MVWVELTVSGQTVQKSLYVGSEDAVQSRVVDFIQMFSESVPEVKGDLHNLGGIRDVTVRSCSGGRPAARRSSYLVLRVSRTDQQQLQGPQVSHSLTWTPDRRLQKRLAEFGEDPAVVQHSEDTNPSHQGPSATVYLPAHNQKPRPHLSWSSRATAM